MSKAILVMDMPESCMGCNFMHCDAESNTESCQAEETARPIDLEKETKPDWCPLKPMPEKMECPAMNGENYEAGWNACIDAIGGTE